MSYNEIFKTVVLMSCVYLISCSPLNSHDENSLASGSNIQSKFTCLSNTGMPESQSRFLTKNQLSNTIEDLFGSSVISESGVESAFSSLSQEGFDEITHDLKSSLDTSKVNAYFNIAKAVSEAIVSDEGTKNMVFGACASSLNSTCIEEFKEEYGQKIMRRPLRDSESTTINDITSGAGTTDEKLRGVLFSLLNSPYFVLRLEMGRGMISGSSFYLTPYEVATKLAYKVTDSTPDNELLEAAKNDALKTKEQLKAQTVRLIQTSRGKKKAVASLLRWSSAAHPKSVAELPSDLIGDLEINGIETAMIHETERFIEHILYEKNGTFKDLLNSKASFAKHEGLAEIYGHAPYVEGQPPQTFGDKRKGILMRAPFYTHTGPRSSIIHRGVDFQLKLLCNKIPEPNVNIAGDRDADSRTHEEQLFHSNRDNVRFQTRSPVCMSCHSVINPTGFALEEFDSLGRLRKQESVYTKEGEFLRNIAVETDTFLPLPNSQEVEIKDSTDLIDFVAESAEGNECFVRNAYRYYNERKESEENHCHLEKSFKKLVHQKKPVLEVLVDIIVDQNLISKR